MTTTTTKQPLDINWIEDVLSDEWVDASIREFLRMKDDGLPYNEVLIQEKDKQWTEKRDEYFFLALVQASLKIDANMKCNATLDQQARRIKTFLFFHMLTQQVGEDRLRERWMKIEEKL